MNSQNLRELLEQADDKLSIFASKETLNKYEITVAEFIELIGNFLSDEEKLELFDYPHFVNFNSTIKSGIIGLVKDENIRLKMIENDGVMKDFASYQIVDLIKKTGDNTKMKLLTDSEFIEKHKIRRL